MRVRVVARVDPLAAGEGAVGLVVRMRSGNGREKQVVEVRSGSYLLLHSPTLAPLQKLTVVHDPDDGNSCRQIRVMLRSG